MQTRFRHAAALPALLLIFLAAAVRAEVTVSLSSSTGQVGAPVQLQYQFINTSPGDMPRSIFVDGLEVRLTGTSQRTQMINMQSTSMSIFVYTIIPNRPGNFTIPGFAVQAGGRQVRTPDVSLRVTGPGGVMPPAPVQPPPGRAPSVSPGMAQPLSPGAGQAQPQVSGRSLPRTADGQPAQFFGEIVLGPRSAYVGEVVPVELRFYFRADCQFDNLQRPSFGGDGFTAAPLSEPDQTEQFIEDVPYNVVTFRSAITPVKTGEIRIPPAVMEGRMTSPGSPPGMDPFFDQFFQNFPMPGFGRAENIEARTNERQLQVQSLPKEGRPESFAGAIGQFTLKAAASPKTAQAGEPVTLTLTVDGRGNFDAIAPPVLEESDGWRTYAPKESFSGADTINYGGTKTFEISMVARTDQTATPGAEFSYFDPIKKKYVTLKADPVAVTAAASGAAADRLAGAGSATPAGGAADQLPPVAGNNDIASPAMTLSATGTSFVPLLHRPWFRTLNTAVLAALIISIPVLVLLGRRAKKSAETAALENELRRSKAAWQKAEDPSEFYAAAAQFVQARLALLDGKPVGLIDPDEAITRRVADPVERRELLTLLGKRDELKYGGGTGGVLPAEERRRVTLLLENFTKNHA